MRRSHAELKNEGVQIEVVAPAWQGLSSHEIDGIRVNRFRYAPKSWEILTHDEGAPNKLAQKPWLQALAIPYIIWGAMVFFMQCLRFKPDILHVHWPFPHGIMALPAHWLLRIPLVLNFHGAELLLAKKKKWVRPILHFVLGHANKILANSSFTKQRIQEIRSVEVQLSPYGTTLANQEEYGGFNQNRGIQLGAKKRILFVGRHILRKGIDVLLHAAQELPSETYQVRIVGHGSETESLKELAQKLQLSNVIFTGKLSKEQLEEEYANAAVFVLPAVIDARGDTEGLGVVLIEAVELGIPLVASQVGGIPDVVIHEKTGLLVAPGDPHELALALLRLTQDQEFANALTQNAKLHVRQNFSWQRVTSDLVSIYKGL